MNADQILTVMAAFITAIATAYIAHFTKNNNQIMKHLQQENAKALKEQQTAYEDIIAHLITSNISTPSKNSQDSNTLLSNYKWQYPKVREFITSEKRKASA